MNPCTDQDVGTFSRLKGCILFAHIREIADYCESDVLNTYRVWLRYELFRGRLSEPDFQASEANLMEFVKVRSNTKPHLTCLM
jgi:3'-5' exonuclease